MGSPDSIATRVAAPGEATGDSEGGQTLILQRTLALALSYTVAPSTGANKIGSSCGFAVGSGISSVVGFRDRLVLDGRQGARVTGAVDMAAGVSGAIVEMVIGVQFGGECERTTCKCESGRAKRYRSY